MRHPCATAVAEKVAPERFGTLTYILPLCADRSLCGSDLERYLRWLASRKLLRAVLVVDGSPAPVASAHHSKWGRFVTHLVPEPDRRTLNGKVGGVLTALSLTETENVVVADDDVRYDDASLGKLDASLRCHRLIRPQNYFSPMPWHAWWDTGRTLVHRALGGDWSGTLAFCRSDLVAAGGYRGDVLFENLELVETLRRRGIQEHVALDLLVKRVPPTAGHFLRQRTRQAYDEFARPPYLIAELTVLPTLVTAWLRRRWTAPAAFAALALGLAERGRRVGGGASAFPVVCIFSAPLWAVERSLCVWLALGLRLAGGVPYRSHRLQRAASVRRWRR
jgi:hypothetical protein